MMVGINFTPTNFVTLLHASTVPTVHSFLFLGHIVLGRYQRFLIWKKSKAFWIPEITEYLLRFLKTEKENFFFVSISVNCRCIIFCKDFWRCVNTNILSLHSGCIGLEGLYVFWFMFQFHSVLERIWVKGSYLSKWLLQGERGPPKESKSWWIEILHIGSQFT